MGCLRHIQHIFERLCHKCAHVVIVSDVLDGVSIEEQNAQVVWSRLQDVRQQIAYTHNVWSN